MNPVNLRDFLDFKFLSDVKLSKNSKNVAYIHSKCNIESDSYDSKLYINNLKGDNKAIDFNKNIKIYCWDNSDNILLFGVDGAQANTDFYRINIDTMDITKAFAVEHKARTIKYIRDGKYLISARVNINSDNKDDDCVIIDELPAQANGEGYISGTRVSLFIYDESLEKNEKIVPEKFETMQFTYSVKNNKILVVGHEYSEVRIIKSGIYMYDIESKTGTVLVEEGKYRMTYVSMIEDDVIFAGTLGENHSIMENPYFYKLNINTKNIEEFSRPDYYIMGLGVGSDCRYGGGTTCSVYENRIYFSSAQNSSCHLFQIDDNGATKQITNLEGSVDIFDVNNNEAVFVGMRDTKLQELYKINLETGSEVQLTHFNEEYANTHTIIDTTTISFTNKDGVEIHGWALEPVDFDESKSYPAILNIHGGPKAAYGTVYYHEMQVWANKGYFVFFCNPRGSDGRGDEFSRVMGRNGTIDYEDIMEFTDHVLEKYPSIDSDRVGVTGGSYGGYLTNWIVGHTDRFAAAATQRSIGDWIVHEYAADTGYWVTSEAYPPNSIIQAEKAWSQSPGKYAVNIKTPILFIHSDQDLRCPLSEAMAVYSGAMRNDADVRMCLFHDENHELSRSGKPSNRVKRLDEITSWMDKYLVGGNK